MTANSLDPVEDRLAAYRREFYKPALVLARIVMAMADPAGLRSHEQVAEEMWGGMLDTYGVSP
jgi:hypothetical protein